VIKGDKRGRLSTTMQRNERFSGDKKFTSTSIASFVVVSMTTPKPSINPAVYIVQCRPSVSTTVPT